MFCQKVANSPSQVLRGKAGAQSDAHVPTQGLPKTLPPGSFPDIPAVREVLELGQGSCSSAELPVTADLAGHNRARCGTLYCLLAPTVMWLHELKTVQVPQKPPSNI